jgi:hypothetical protein
MLKRLFLVSVSTLLCQVPASAETLFRGAFFVTAVDSCTSANEGDFYNAQFHPSALLPGNSDFSAINTIYPFGGTSYHLLTGSFTSSFLKVTNVSLGWSDFKPDKPSFVLVSKQTPATLDATTKSVTLTGKVKNPFGITGEESCVETFLFVGGRNIQ